MLRWTLYWLVSGMLSNVVHSICKIIPLLDFKGEYEVYCVHNISLPLYKGQNEVPEVSHMVARYDVEYTWLLINKDRTPYTPLHEYEMFTCSNRVTRYCSPENAILPINLIRLCILALFLKNDRNVDKYCHKVVLPNALLPMWTYLDQGLWVIGTKEKLDFAVVCLGPSGGKSVKNISYRNHNGSAWRYSATSRLPCSK